MQRFEFTTREEVINFLEKYDFKYYIPRLCEHLQNTRNDRKKYYIEIKNNKVYFCSIFTVYSDNSLKQQVFFDSDLVYKLHSHYNKEICEEQYKEYLNLGIYN